MVLSLLYVAIWLVVSATMAAYLVGLSVPAWWGRWVALVGIGFFAVASVVTACGAFIAWDFRSFWELGRVLLAGDDPSAFVASHPLPPLNPPTSYPLFAAFALLPLKTGLVVWVAVSVLLCLAMVPISLRTLAERDVPGASSLPRWAVALIAAAFVVSNTPRSMLQGGQLSAVGAFGLIAALAAQSAGRPAWAGFWLVPGTIKPNSALPFLVLFHRRRDMKTWLVAAVLCGVICLAAGWGHDPIGRATLYLKTVTKHGARARSTTTASPTPKPPAWSGSITPCIGLDFAHRARRAKLRSRYLC